MAGKGQEGRRVCRCDRADGSCAGQAVRRLSQARVRELAEEIWAASSGDRPATPPAPADPRSSRPGASAQAAYRRHRDQERAAWPLDWAWWTLAVVAAAAVGAFVVGLTLGDWLAGPAALVVAALTGWRLRFRPSAGARSWRRQAALQRRTAAALEPLQADGYLVLHDLTLPGWLDSLDHLVVGPTGVWLVRSWPRPHRWLGRAVVPAGIARELWSQTQAITQLLDGRAQVPVRPLVCLHRRWPPPPTPTHGLAVTTPARLPDLLRHGPTTPAHALDHATTHLLHTLRPAT